MMSLIIRKYDFIITIACLHNHNLCCRGTCVNTEIAVSGIVFQVTGFYMIVSVPAGKSIVIFLAGKQRGQTGNFKLQLNAGGKTLLQRS